MRHRTCNRVVSVWRARMLVAVAALLVPSMFAARLPPVRTVFVVLLENHDWSSFQGQTNAPFLNSVLLPMASYCNQYFNSLALHPSLPNYLWLEAGTNFGILDNGTPAQNHQATTNHLVALLDRAGISWKTYQEDISGQYVPLSDTNLYAVRHNPFVYFDDVTGTNDPNCAYGIAHIRPYPELANDLKAGAVARYNFITPNLCHGGHDACGPVNDAVRQVDNWLAAEIPKIMASPAYRDGGAIFITWDEGVTDGPIGMILLSRLARGGGYCCGAHHTHGSLLRTLQEIFGVTPLLGEAAVATGLDNLFAPLVIADWSLSNGVFQMTITAIDAGRTNVVQASTNLVTWTNIGTNSSPSNTFSVLDSGIAPFDRRFYRVVQLP